MKELIVKNDLMHHLNNVVDQSLPKGEITLEQAKYILSLLSNKESEEGKIKIGSRVRLKEAVPMFKRTYPKGHEFIVYNQSYRGWDLVDKNGERMDETGMITDKLELI